MISILVSLFASLFKPFVSSTDLDASIMAVTYLISDVSLVAHIAGIGCSIQIYYVGEEKPL